MPQRTSSHVESGVRKAQAIDVAALDIGVVTSAPKTDADGLHHVAVQNTRVPVDDPIPVIPPVHGDYYVPPEGTPVLVAQFGSEEFAIVGSPVPETRSSTVTAGERVLSHPLSQATVAFNEDGSIDVYGDTTVRVNGGSTGVITDVTANTTTDSDGHVTSVSLDITRNDNVLVPK